MNPTPAALSSTKSTSSKTCCDSFAGPFKSFNDSMLNAFEAGLSASEQFANSLRTARPAIRPETLAGLTPAARETSVAAVRESFKAIDAATTHATTQARAAANHARKSSNINTTNAWTAPPTIAQANEHFTRAFESNVEFTREAIDRNAGFVAEQFDAIAGIARNMFDVAAASFEDAANQWSKAVPGFFRTGACDESAATNSNTANTTANGAAANKSSDRSSAFAGRGA